MDSPNGTADRYQHFLTGAALAELSPRSRIWIGGRDRATLLHGFCTNDIRRLQPGQGCEAFLTTAQGHVAGYIDVFCEDNALVLETAAGQADSIIQSLDRYVIREDVRFADQTADFHQWLVAGPASSHALTESLSEKGSDPLRRLQYSGESEPPPKGQTPFRKGFEALGGPLPTGMFDHAAFFVAGQALSVRRTPFVAGDCFSLAFPTSAVAEMTSRLQAAGCVWCTPEDLEVRRVESGTPIFGRDITDANLPQEVNRTERAISFQKGCYLGQETIARLDALGHVNWLLMGLQFDGPAPPAAGWTLSVDDKVAARVTSAVWSRRLGAPLAMAYLRRGCEAVGTRLPTPYGLATVVRLPIE